MKSFDVQRFTLLMKHELTEHSRSYLRFILGAFAAFFIINIFISYETAMLHTSMPIDDIAGPILHSVSGASIAIIVLLMIVSISNIYSNMNTKQERIRFLMLPATNLEKYLCRWLQFSVIGTLLIIAAYCAADICCWMVRCILGHGLGLSMTYFFDDLYHGLFSHRVWKDGLIAFYVFNPSESLLLIALLSTYHLGGAFFRRVPYIFTTLTIIAVGIVMVIINTTIATIIISQWDNAFPSILERIDNYDVILFFIFELLPTVWIILCHWLSYRMLTRANVITHKTIGL